MYNVCLSEKATEALKSKKITAFVPISARDLIWLEACASGDLEENIMISIDLGILDAIEIYRDVFQITFIEYQQRCMLTDEGKTNDSDYTNRQEMRYSILSKIWNLFSTNVRESLLDSYNLVEQIAVDIRREQDGK